MSNMESLNLQLSEKERQQRVYEAAMASLARQKMYREGEGLTLMFAWDAFGEETQKGIVGKAAKGAELFCIGFAFLAPCLLFATYVL